jgi:hypothetical protein
LTLAVTVASSACFCECGELGALLVDLVNQQLPLHSDQRAVRLLRRAERGGRIRIVA